MSTPKGICPAALGSKDQQPFGLFARRPACSTCRPTTSAWITSRFKVELCRGSRLSSARPPQHVSGPRGATTPSRQLHRLGCDPPARSKWSPAEPFSVWSGRVGRLPDGVGVLRHAGRLSEGGRRRDRQGALQVQDSVGHHRQRQQPTSSTASSISQSCRALAAGPASAWRRA